MKNNIQSIAQENTFTVATGHQLCLFIGPLYFIYKIISTLNLSEKLKESYPEYNFVPIFWMATEDNDFEEVNHVHLFGNKLTWNQTQKGGVGEIETNSLKSTLDQLKSILGDSKEAKELYHLFSSAYLKHNNLTVCNAFVNVVDYQLCFFATLIFSVHFTNSRIVVTTTVHFYRYSFYFLRLKSCSLLV